MSNSNLMNYIKLSPNCNKGRNHIIDTITIHCVVGQCTVEQLGEIFAKPERKASSNYGIGKDGRIGLYVNESDRSWCSSSRENDNRAVTIEVASDTKDPYTVNQVALDKLVELCADICKRNGIQKLVWSVNKEDRINHRNGANMTVHRDFAAKDCPGAYLYGKHGWIASEVNKILAEDKKSDKKTVSMSTKEIYQYFIDKGMTPEGVAGLLGNLQAESGMRSNNLENSFNRKLNMTDEEYVSAVNSGDYSKYKFCHDLAGFGLAQWCHWSRKEFLYNYAESIGHTIDSTQMQVWFLNQELINNYWSVYEVLKSSHNLRECSNCVLTQFEQPKNQGEEVKAYRYNMALSILTKYKTDKKKYSTTPFIVKNVADQKIRATASDKAEVTGICPIGTYTIVEVDDHWGRLKSGLGWLNLDYVDILS